jgi:hypothetical protein
MADLCLEANLETLQPLYRGTHRLQGDLYRSFYEGSQTVEVVVTLLASHVFQNSPQFIVLGLDSPRPNPWCW